MMMMNSGVCLQLGGYTVVYSSGNERYGTRQYAKEEDF